MSDLLNLSIEIQEWRDRINSLTMQRNALLPFAYLVRSALVEHKYGRDPKEILDKLAKNREGLASDSYVSGAESMQRNGK